MLFYPLKNCEKNFEKKTLNGVLSINNLYVVDLRLWDSFDSFA